MLFLLNLFNFCHNLNFSVQTYETRINHQRKDQIVVSVVFSNLTKNTIKDLEFNVLDTLNTKLIRGVCSLL